MKNYPPQRLTETWLFLANSVDPEFKEAKRQAMNKIVKAFGSLEIAEMYLETFEWDIDQKIA